MGRFVQMVLGPAGVGKSSYCKTMQEHGRATKRTIHVANLDPASDTFEYECAFDIKELITLDEVMEQLEYGPNGGLVYCMEHLLENADWLKDELDDFGDDEYVLLDCPGQIELYSHLPIMHNLAKQLQMWGYTVVSVYLLDALFVVEPSKFISGCLLSLSCMLQLELPHVNVVTKCDIADKSEIDRILSAEGAWMVNQMRKQSNSKLAKLTEAISSVVDDYMMVSFATLDVTDEDSIAEVLALTDHALQYGEDAEHNETFEGDEMDENYED